jgi:RNA polymerase sigma-70 factor (ECF subfamily)
MQRMRETVEKVLAGNREAFREIVKAYGPAIRALLAAHLPDAATLDDLAQETFISGYESLPTFKLDSDLGPWLKAIARNKLNMHLRSTYRQENALQRLKASAVLEILPESCALMDGDTSSTLVKLRECVGKLPERIHSVVRARYFDRQKVGAIAARMETSTTAISSLLFRGRKQLETCIKGSQ